MQKNNVLALNNLAEFKHDLHNRNIETIRGAIISCGYHHRKPSHF